MCVPCSKALVASRAETLLELTDRIADILSDAAGKTIPNTTDVLERARSLAGLAVIGSLVWSTPDPSIQQDDAFSQLPLGVIIFIAALLTVFVHFIGFLFADHLHQADIAPSLGAMSVIPVLPFGVSLVIFVGVDVVLRALGSACVNPTHAQLQCCD